MLRIGVALDSLEPNAWIAYILEELQKSQCTTVQLLLLTTGPEPALQGRPVRASGSRNRTLFGHFEAWDYRRNRTAPDAREFVNVDGLLDSVPRLRLGDQQESAPGALNEHDLAAIRDANLDVVLDFTEGAVPAEVLPLARYGVWSVQHSGDLACEGAPPLFWEMYQQNPVSNSVVQVRTSLLDCGKVIYRSYSATHPRSLHRNRNPVYWKTAEGLLRRLRDLDSRGWTYIQNLPTYNEPGTTGPKLTNAPGTGQMLRFLGTQVTRAVRASAKSRLHGGHLQWFLALRRRTPGQPFDSAAGYQPLPVPEDRFYADPKLITHDGRTWLFFEDFRYGDNRALISCCELEQDGTLGEPFEVLRRPYHLSYPFVFEHQGEMYMIPETRENRAVELYRAQEFPRTWVFEKALLANVAAVDATIHVHHGRLWMFVGLSANGRYSTCDELALYFADHLHGPWHPHPDSPVVSDVRLARPAGALFLDNGRLIRPSQDCGKAYGYALNFSEIVKLTPTEYEERLLSRITPDWLPGNLGTHTYTRSADFEIIDGNFPKKLPK